MVELLTVAGEDDQQQQQSTMSSNGGNDKTEIANVPSSSSSTTLQINDDKITLTQGTDDAAFIDVLENDESSSSSLLLVVRSITAQATNGECVISIDLQQVVYTPTNMDYSGSDKCTYEACIVDEDNEWSDECGTAVVRIEIEEEEETSDISSTTGNIADTNTTSDLIIESTQKLVSDVDTINADATVAIHGDTAIVGDSSHDNYKGVVLVFARDDGTSNGDEGGSSWTQQAKLVSPDDAAWTHFGSSLAIHKDTIIVGAQGDEDNKGCAHIFVRDGDDGTWYHEAKLEAPDGEANDYFGYDVAIHEDTAIVGASHDGGEKGEKSGSAHVFVRYGDAWTPQDKLVAPDGSANDRFGNSVGIYGDTAIVGAWWDDDNDDEETNNSTNSGSAHIYVRNNEGDGTWTHEQKLMDIVGESEDRFGNRVAIYGDTVVVGARGDDDDDDNNDGTSVDSGSAYVLVRNGDTWTHQSKLVAPDGAAGDQFGNSIAIYGNTVVVGARWDDDNGKESGSAHVYVRDGLDNWVHRVKLLAADGDAEDHFGFSVGIHDETVVVGSKSGDTHVISDYLGQS